MLHDYSETPVFFDFETQSCADLPEIGGRLYAECPSTRVLSLSALIDRDLHIWIPKNVAAPYRGELYLPPEYRPLYDTFTLHQTETLPEPIERAISAGRTFAAHNCCGFDRFIWEECVTKRGLGSLPQKWADTLYLARLAGLPRGGLDAIAEQLLGTSKDAAKKIVMPLTRAVWANGEPEYPRVQAGMIDPLVRYCSVDTLILAQLWEKFGDLIVESDAIQAHQNINDRGIAVDLSLSTRLVIVAAEASRRAAEEIEELTKGELYGDTATRKGNLRSTEKVHAWLKKQGVEIVMEVAGETGTVKKRTLRKDVVEQYLANPLLMLGEDTEVSLEALKNFNADVLPLVTKVLRLRVTATRITSAKAEKMGKRACADGRIYDLHTYHKAHCVSGDTEVLTVNGWERIDRWQGGHIAQWYSNGTIVFDAASNNVFTTDEPTLTLDSPYLSGVFTLGHTVPGYTQAGVFRPMKAEDVAKQNRRTLPISGDLRHEGSITADQMRVLVAIQADGHWCTDTKQGRGLQLAVKRERKILRARGILTKAGIVFRENEFPSHPGTIRFSIRWDDCPSWLTPERKTFGPWVLDSTHEARHAMIEEMQLWDGSQANPQGNASYASKLDINHEWMSIIAHLTGKSMLQRSMQSMLRDSITAGVQAKHWVKTPALDKVYCPTTKTGYWVYRHNGKIGITGNTGRASSQGVQIHNMPRGKKGVKVGKLLTAHENGEWPKDAAKAYDFIYAECLDPAERQKGLTVDDALSSLIRPCFLAKDKHKLGIADYAAIESRGIAWIAGEDKLLDAFAAGRDVYCEFASILYGREIIPNTGKQPPERQVGKITILGCGYGMGVEKFALTAALLGVDLKKAGTSAEKCVETYRAAYQKIAGHYSGSFNGRTARRGGIWEQLNTAAMRAVVEGGRHTAGKCHFVYAGGILRVTLPSGRELRYNNCRVEDRIPSYAISLDLDVKARPTIVYVGERGEVSLYGGKIAENLTQAICRDILYTALIRGEMFGIPFVADVHDETIGEYPEQLAAEYLQKQCILMSHPPEWADGFPIAVEGYTSRRYVKEAAVGEYQVTAINGVITHAEYKRAS